MQNLIPVPADFLQEMMARLVRTECKLTALMEAQNLDAHGRPRNSQPARSKLAAYFS